MHKKPCGLLNVNGYFDPLITFVDHTVDQQFVSPASRSLVIMENTPEKLLRKFEHYEAPQSDKASWALRMSDKLAGI